LHGNRGPEGGDAGIYAELLVSLPSPLFPKDFCLPLLFFFSLFLLSRAWPAGLSCFSSYTFNQMIRPCAATVRSRVSLLALLLPSPRDLRSSLFSPFLPFPLPWNDSLRWFLRNRQGDDEKVKAAEGENEQAFFSDPLLFLSPWAAFLSPPFFPLFSPLRPAKQREGIELVMIRLREKKEVGIPTLLSFSFFPTRLFPPLLFSPPFFPGLLARRRRKGDI